MHARVWHVIWLNCQCFPKENVKTNTTDPVISAHCLKRWIFFIEKIMLKLVYKRNAIFGLKNISSMKITQFQRKFSNYLSAATPHRHASGPTEFQTRPLNFNTSSLSVSQQNSTLSFQKLSIRNTE